MSLPYFRRVSILGVGLMGGSLGLALRGREMAGEIVGYEPDVQGAATAVRVGALDRVAEAPETAVHDADLIVVAAPVGVIPPLLERIAPDISPTALVTDLGSTKLRIVQAGGRLFGPRFVGGHPMAGGVEVGAGAARADLFAGAAWAIVRDAPFTLDTDPHAAHIARLAEALGARPLMLDAAQHDRIVALVSHLPHLLSFAFAHTVAAAPDPAVAQSLAGASYRDLIRVSHSDPKLWAEILVENRAYLSACLSSYRRQLGALAAAVESGDTDRVTRILALQAALPSEDPAHAAATGSDS